LNALVVAGRSPNLVDITRVPRGLTVGEQTAILVHTGEYDNATMSENTLHDLALILPIITYEPTGDQCPANQPH